jgi:hypothetical protein
MLFTVHPIWRILAVTFFVLLSRVIKHRVHKIVRTEIDKRWRALLSSALQEGRLLMVEFHRSGHVEFNRGKRQLTSHSRRADQQPIRPLLRLAANICTSCCMVELLELRSTICKSITLSVFLYGCETWSLILRVEHRLRLLQNRVLRRIFGPKWNEVRGGWRQLHNGEPSIIGMMTSRRMRWARHVARREEDHT